MKGALRTWFRYESSAKRDDVAENFDVRHLQLLLVVVSEHVLAHVNPLYLLRTTTNTH